MSSAAIECSEITAAVEPGPNLEAQMEPFVEFLSKPETEIMDKENPGEAGNDVVLIEKQL